MLEEEILNIISKNAKVTTEDLAAMLASTPDQVEKCLKEMEESGIICGYPALINWDSTSPDFVI